MAMDESTAVIARGIFSRMKDTIVIRIIIIAIVLDSIGETPFPSQQDCDRFGF